MLTKEKILNEAFYNFAINGYYGTSLSKIAGNVGLKKPAIYNYYDNKDELFSLCIDKCMEKGINHFEKINISNSLTKEYILEFSKRYIFDDIMYISFYFNMALSPDIHKSKIDYWNYRTQLIIEERLKMILKDDANLYANILHIRTFYNGWLARRYFSSDDDKLTTSINEFEKDFHFLYERFFN